jgi:hypothetical protein
MNRHALAAAAFALAALPAAHAATIHPAQPSSFDPVNLRLAVDLCVFNPASVAVTSEGNVLKVTQSVNNCLVPGEQRVVDIRLGTLAAGEYRVEVFHTHRTDGPPAETLRFSVLPRPEAAVFPPIVRPLTDHSGVWYNPDQAGWGLSIWQAPTHVVFGALFVYGGNNQPLWATLQGGQWESSTVWRGTVHLTTGPAFSAPVFDARQVTIQAVGQATLDFTNVPVTGRASFTYNVNNIPVTTTIARMVF